MDSPETPDYAGQAAAQGQANLDTARFNANANRPDVYSPTGSQEWVKHPSDPDRWVLRETLSPAEQAKLESSQRIQQGGLSALEAGLPQVRDALSGGFDTPGEATTGYLKDPQWGIQFGLPDYGKLPGMVNTLDTSGLGAMPQADAGVRQKAEDALYQRQASRLDPQFAQLTADLESQLANQGLARGTKAWNAEAARLGRQRTDAYSTAQQNAIAGGGQEMKLLQDLMMQVRQQGFGELLDKGNFANAARGQGYGEQVQNNQLWNSNVNQDVNQKLAEAQLFNQGHAQRVGENQQNKMLPINIMASMLGLGQVNAPQYQPFNNQITAEPPPIMAAAQGAHQANVSASNARNATIGSGVSAAAGIAAAAIIA